MSPHPPASDPLATPLSQVRGVGPNLLRKLAKIGLVSVEDALYTLPNRYEDRRQIRKIAQLQTGRQEVFLGEVLAAAETQTSRRGKRLYEVVVGDGTGQVVLKWFHFRKEWMRQRFPVGKRLLIVGEVKRFGPLREVHHPEVEFLEAGTDPESLLAADPLNFGRILPVYPLTDGLSQKVARRIWKEIVDRFAPCSLSLLPKDLQRKRRLLPLAAALQQAHWPEGEVRLEDLENGCDAGRRTLVYDEFFFLELGLALKRRGVILEPGIPFTVHHRYTGPLAKLLPYRLTDAQRRVLGEIKRDLMAPHPMNRLVQGDVGSGKTIVALMAALLAIENGTQVAVVAPTEILAEQHYLQFHPWMEALGLNVALLTGSTPARRRREILQGVAEGSLPMLVGTHAVLQEGVDFSRLGLGIIDEQHRFGVRQRSVLRKKGVHPHVLVMTATPIPRTLSLTLFGDLALSVIDELPPGRSPIRTRVLVGSARSQAYQHIHQELRAGRQAYIVYPLVEETEKSDLLAATEAAEYLAREVFPGRRVGLLHGKLRPEEKEGVMASFKAGEVQVLVATTVIEVGIDVPNATVMMVEHAERFGLAQLHQLRGRVGRGSAASVCLLIRSARCSEDGLRRLQVMAETSDGFRIAEADLEIRGPGEFLGTRQAGIPDFRVANLLRDGRVLEEAREDAFEMVERGDFLHNSDFSTLRTELLKRWGTRLELANVG